MKAYLTVCHGGRGLITHMPPVIAKIRGTEHEDAFSQVGEPVDVRHLCQPVLEMLLVKLPPPLLPRRVEITMRYLD